MKNTIIKYWKECGAAFKSPTLKQKESYARLLHTLSAACIIGAVTLIWSADGPPHLTWSIAFRSATLILGFVVTLISGALLSKGEEDSKSKESKPTTPRVEASETKTDLEKEVGE